MSQEREYVLGTHDEEITRLGLQHRVWRARALDSWLRAGFRQGQTLLDVGCGPGYATLDLAEMTGPSGKVVAVDRSRRFLDFLQSESHRRGLTNIEVFEADLDEDELPKIAVDGVWVRWVFTFVKRPKELLTRIARLLKLHPIVDVIEPSSFIWEWPRTYVKVGLERLVDLGRVTPDQARRVLEDFAKREAAPGTRMITPAVLEIVGNLPTDAKEGT